MLSIVVKVEEDTVTIEFDTDNPKEIVEPVYTEESPFKDFDGYKDAIKDFLSNSAGLTGLLINPDSCSAEDVVFALTTRYYEPSLIDGVIGPDDWTIETDIEIEPVEPLEDGGLY